MNDINEKQDDLIEIREDVETLENQEENINDEETIEVSAKKTFIEIIKDYAFPIAMGVIIFLIFSIFARPGVVNGTSMYPTYEHGDRFIILNDFWINEYERGDIVCINENGRILIKRVIGVGGDVITFEDGKVIVNGETLEEDYLQPDVNTYPYLESLNTFVIPEGSYFVLGDNRNASLDSRYFGPTNDMEGKAFFWFRKSWFR
jgi:signal peptidase I